MACAVVEPDLIAARSDQVGIGRAVAIQVTERTIGAGPRGGRRLARVEISGPIVEPRPHERARFVLCEVCAHRENV